MQVLMADARNTLIADAPGHPLLADSAARHARQDALGRQAAGYRAACRALPARQRSPSSASPRAAADPIGPGLSPAPLRTHG